MCQPVICSVCGVGASLLAMYSPVSGKHRLQASYDKGKRSG
jgi:hypothetical protein